MIWPDWKIEAACWADDPLIWPFRKEQLNPASYDLRLEIMIEVDTKDLQLLDISDRTEERPYWLTLGIFALLLLKNFFIYLRRLQVNLSLKAHAPEKVTRIY